MKTKMWFFVAFLLVGFSSVIADRQLDKTEISQILRTLTDTPKHTWIPGGTIAAAHQEFSASSGYKTDSIVKLMYDGERFYWEISIDSHVREPKPNKRDREEGLDINRNRHRVFAWDGQFYTMYFKSGNHAIVMESPVDIPVAAAGPLTAGVIPWGYGLYTPDNLLEFETSAIETEDDGQKKMHLTLDKTGSTTINMTLDPSKNYAVLSCSVNNPGRSLTTQTFGDYKLTGEVWIPKTIIIERYDSSEQEPKLLSYDYWNIKYININFSQFVPKPKYETNALVEFHSPMLGKPLSYRYSEKVDTELLFQEKLDILLSGDMRSQNCATSAMRYVAKRLGKEISEDKISELAEEPDKGTSLYSMMQFSRDLGFYCLAVRTDIAALKDLSNCKVILHLPRAKHYVVLEHADDASIWLIDLSDDKFYYSVGLDDFRNDWSDGTALLLSNKPLDAPAGSSKISEDKQHTILGSDGAGFGTYSCTDLIQEYNVQFCSEMVLGTCGGVYEMWYTRYGCELDEGGGYCTGTGIVGSVYSYCIEDALNPGECTTTGEYYSRYVRACQ
jgi:hypothetical protein